MLSIRQIFVIVVLFAAFMGGIWVLCEHADHRDRVVATQIIRNACGEDALQRFNSAFNGVDNHIKRIQAYEWAKRCAVGTK